MSFKSVLKKIGEDFKLGLNALLKYKQAEEAAVAAFAPALGPLFNSTVTAIATAEQNAAALGQEKNGPAKLASVVSIAGGLIKQGLTDAGKVADEAAVEGYINDVVNILNVAAAPPGA